MTETQGPGGGCGKSEEGRALLTDREIGELLPEVPGWQLVASGETPRIARDLAFDDFRSALAFVNRVGELAEMEGHHPDIHLTGYNKVRLVVWSHSLGGLHRSDFILAAKVNRLL